MRISILHYLLSSMTSCVTLLYFTYTAFIAMVLGMASRVAGALFMLLCAIMLYAFYHDEMKRQVQIKLGDNCKVLLSSAVYICLGIIYFIYYGSSIRCDWLGSYEYESHYVLLINTVVLLYVFFYGSYCMLRKTKGDVEDVHEE